MRTMTPYELCNMFSEDELVEHLGVSSSTARRYQKGIQEPNKAALRLF